MLLLTPRTYTAALLEIALIERERVHQLGPRPDKETAARWRASDDFQNHLAAIRETLERFEPVLLEHVVTKR